MQKEKPYVVRKFEEGEVYEENGVFGWYFPQTDEHRPFNDEQMVALVEAGYATEQERQITALKYIFHTKKVIEDYRQSRKNMTAEDRAEMMSELRACHGAGETIVDIFTGEKFYT